MADQPPGRARRSGAGFKTSIYDVAALAGVSHQTVSRVLNGHPHIRAATRERVEAAIRQTAYTPSATARALATNRSRRIGVLVDSPLEFGPGSTMRGIEQAARSAGYTVAARTVDGDLAGAYEHLKLQGVEALCVIAPRYSTMATLREVGRDLPTVLLKAEPEDDAQTAAVDQYAGAVHAVDHLLELGHRAIAHLAGPADWADARVRARAFSDRLGAEGLPLLPEVSGDWSSDSGYELGRSSEVFARATAVFVGNDQMALGLIHGLHERGIRVPEDISVVGFDDLPDARHFLPPLTTVRQDFGALGRLSMEMVIAQLEDDDPPLSAMLEPELIVRASTAPPR